MEMGDNIAFILSKYECMVSVDDKMTRFFWASWTAYKIKYILN